MSGVLSEPVVVLELCAILIESVSRRREGTGLIRVVAGGNTAEVAD